MATSNHFEFNGTVDSEVGIGSKKYLGETIGSCTCSLCLAYSSFKQWGVATSGYRRAMMIPVKCENCDSVLSLNADGRMLLPPPGVGGIDDLPEDIEEYYDEALDCINAGAPNGAATLFRKTIHALGIHYEVAEVDDNISIYKIIERLNEEGQLNPKLKESLLAIKDLGNDGAHINENEPDIEQAHAMKRLIDAVLNSTVKTDQDIEFAREQHPNSFDESS